MKPTVDSRQTRWWMDKKPSEQPFNDDEASLSSRELIEQTTFVGTLLWEAPEILRGDALYFSSVDVYSYGSLAVGKPANFIFNAIVN